MPRVLLVLALSVWATGVGADAYVTTTCGTLPVQYPVGSTQKISVDVNGNTCV